MSRLIKIKNNIGDTITVAENKKRHIENIIKAAEKCKQITGIILFGSALEERCTDKSDIDLAIISCRTVNELSKTVGFKKFLADIYAIDEKQEYDRLYFKYFEEIIQKRDKVPICAELVQKGKIIYRRI